MPENRGIDDEEGDLAEGTPAGRIELPQDDIPLEDEKERTEGEDLKPPPREAPAGPGPGKRQHGKGRGEGPGGD